MSKRKSKNYIRFLHCSIKKMAWKKREEKKGLLIGLFPLFSIIIMISLQLTNWANVGTHLINHHQ